MDESQLKKPDFNPGAIPDREDMRDFKWQEVGAGAPAFDWQEGYDIETELAKALGLSSFELAPKDQNGSGSCGGQAWAAYMAVQEALSTKTYEERSAKYCYSQTYVAQPGGGSMGRDNANLCAKQGICREAVLSSYENGNPPSEAFMRRAVDITEEARADAKKARSLAYVNVPCAIDYIAQAVKATGGVVLGIAGSNNGTWTTEQPNPPAQIEWRHWVYVGKARIKNGKRQLGFLNSWGKNIGKRGWQWIDEDYFTGENIFSVWVHVYNDAPPPVGYTHHFTAGMKLGDENDEVRALQTALQQEGLFPATIKPTRYYGNITREAVLAFQRKYNVAPPEELNALAGRSVGPKTLAALNLIFNK